MYPNRYLILCLVLTILFQDLIILAQNHKTTRGLFKKHSLDEASWNAYIKVFTLTLSKRSLVECGGFCKKWRSFPCVYFALENDIECQLGKEAVDENTASISIGEKSVYYLSQERPISVSGDCYSPEIMHMTANPNCDLHPAEPDFFRVVPKCESRNPFNYWLAPPGATGMDAHFVLDLGCRMNVQSVELKNTYNMHHSLRATKKFTLELSDDVLYVHGGMSWTTAVSGTLNSISSEACGNGCSGILTLALICIGSWCCEDIPTQVFPFRKVHTARATRDFTLELSDDALYVHGGMSWTTAATGTLNSISSDDFGDGCSTVKVAGACTFGVWCCDRIPTQVFPFGQVHTARYARFIATLIMALVELD